MLNKIKNSSLSLSHSSSFELNGERKASPICICMRAQKKSFHIIASFNGYFRFTLTPASLSFESFPFSPQIIIASARLQKMLHAQHSPYPHRSAFITLNAFFTFIHVATSLSLASSARSRFKYRSTTSNQSRLSGMNGNQKLNFSTHFHFHDNRRVISPSRQIFTQLHTLRKGVESSLEIL